MSCSPRTKKTSAQAVESDLRAQLAHLHGQVTERKASNASNEKDSSSSAFNSRALTKRVQDSSKQEMQTAAESAMGDQRARYRAKLTATRSELDMANSSIAAMTADLDAMRRDHELERTVLKNDLEEARKSHLSVSAKPAGSSESLCFYGQSRRWRWCRGVPGGGSRGHASSPLPGAAFEHD